MSSHTDEKSSAATARADNIDGGSETSQPRATGSIAQPPGPAAAAVKQKPAAKSIVILDIKPWGMSIPSPFSPQTCRSLLTYHYYSKDDTTDMQALESGVRAIEHDGLVWGASKLVPVGFGVQKLQVNLVVEDEKVSVTDLQEQVEELEDYVQSSDVVTMQKL
jgi:elongation factor 1-beta